MSADEMLKDLGYKKVHENESGIEYIYTETLLGDKFEYILIISKISRNIYHIDNIEKDYTGIGFELLKAINTKVKELRMGGINNE